MSLFKLRRTWFFIGCATPIALGSAILYFASLIHHNCHAHTQTRIIAQILNTYHQKHGSYPETLNNEFVLKYLGENEIENFGRKLEYSVSSNIFILTYKDKREHFSVNSEHEWTNHIK